MRNKMQTISMQQLQRLYWYFLRSALKNCIVIRALPETAIKKEKCPFMQNIGMEWTGWLFSFHYYYNFVFRQTNFQKHVKLPTKYLYAMFGE